MPKIFAFGDCNCDDWNEHAQDISDRIVSSLKISAGIATGYDMYQGVQFRFCPYCGRKLVVAGAGLEKLGTWKGKPIQEYDNAGLIEIIGMLGKYISWFKEEVAAQIEGMENLLGGS